jgi:hypothetical protein
MAGKPKGGRGKKAPYATKLMRVPEPIAAQVDALGLRYQEFIAAGGDSANPPFFLVERIQKQPDAVKQKRTRTAVAQLTEKTSSEFIEAEKLSKEELVWKELNLRQQTYLRLIFEIDQHREALERGPDWRRSTNRPASQWRWIEYAEIFGKSTTLRMRIKEAGEVDPGTGSTFKALSARKLIEIRYPYEDVQWLDCKLTKQGRAVVRAGLRLQAPKKSPKGQLRERQWAALVAAYVAGDGGVKRDVNLNYGGFSWEWTWLRLRDYSDGSLIEERSFFNEAGRHEYDLVISQFGRHFYRSYWKKYRELYPNVNAPEPT